VRAKKRTQDGFGQRPTSARGSLAPHSREVVTSEEASNTGRECGADGERVDSRFPKASIKFGDRLYISLTAEQKIDRTKDLDITSVAYLLFAINVALEEDGWKNITFSDIGTREMRSALFSGVPVKRFNMPVSVGPGATTLMRTPDSAYSSAAALVRPSTACLLAP
jgi:hypothetical protein